MKISSAFVATLVLFAGKSLADRDAHIDFVETCSENGFASESYTVITDDGYVAQLYRIPGRFGDTKTHKPAVLLMAGIECDMNFWTVNDPSVAPPFVLAEAGYDVWLGNNRGTRYAQYHVELDPASAHYWRFSQEEMGLHDLPAFIDYVLAKTGQDQLTYVGHSQGTTQMFLGASLNPDYFKKKVNLFVALGPVTSLNNINVPALRAVSKDWKEVEYLAWDMGAYDLLDANWLEEEATQAFCNQKLAQGLCVDILAYVADANPDVDNLDKFDVFLKDFPAGSGYQNIVYYAQTIQSVGEWLRYDFGGARNMDVYGSFYPPKIPIEQLSIPTALFIGEYDNLATVADNEWLK